MLTQIEIDDKVISLNKEEGRKVMSVAVACNLADGVILGVDSAITLNAPDGSVMKVYENAVKLFQLGEKFVGIATFGLGSMGNRSIGCYIREFEIGDPNHVVSRPAGVSAIVEELRKFFLEKYYDIVVPQVEEQTGQDFVDIPEDEVPTLGLVVGGYSEGSYLSQVCQILIPFHAEPNSAQVCLGEGEFSSYWFALYEPIFRYHKGFDDNVLRSLIGYVENLRRRPLTEQQRNGILDILEEHEYKIPFDAMPLGEGIAYVKFLVEMVINHFRFSIGAPVVGGRAQIGLVTYKGEKFKILEGG